MKKRLFAAILTIAMLMSLGVTALAENEDAQISERRKIIIDVDSAADDVTAILLAAADSEIDILGVTVAAGNVSLQQATDNTLMALEIAGRSDVPVFKGAEKSIDGTEKSTFSIFGNDGMGDMGLIHPSQKASDKPAVDFILDTLREYPGEVEIVCLAPATNLAECILKDAETMHSVKRIWSMGTSGLGMGNATPVAEFNVYMDAQAYDILLKEELPLTVMGLDMGSSETYFTEPHFERMKNGNQVTQFVEKSYRKLADNKKETCGYSFGDCFDAIAMACALWPDFVKSSVNTKAVCVTDSPACFGQVVFYLEGQFYVSMIAFDNYSTQLITDVDESAFVDMAINILMSIE